MGKKLPKEIDEIDGIAWRRDGKGVVHIELQNYLNEAILVLSVPSARKLRNKIKGKAFPKKVGELRGLCFEDGIQLKKSLDEIIQDIKRDTKEQRKLKKIRDGNLSRKLKHKKLMKITTEERPRRLDVIGDAEAGTLMAVWVSV